MAKGVKHLAEQFKPQSYTLDITTDRDNKTFSGSVIISGRHTHRPNHRITLHQVGLKFKKATITHHSKNSDANVTVDRIVTHNGSDEVRIHTKDKLFPGNYTIVLHFFGKITDQMNGIYPCFFKDKNKNKQLLATQFESHHARELFPCIDEPDAKAIFDLTLRTVAGETVISNMPVVSQTVEDTMLVTKFESTPRMSTYLLAFVTGELVYKEGVTKNGVIVRSYAVPEKKDFLDFSVDISVKLLDFFNDYFGIDYPLPKCDLVALPDFASGAMENWGLITFREHGLLLDPDNTSVQGQQYIATVVAHELAHQWFGNLVTMKWWTDLWLNEGFASWIEYMAVDFLFPEWGMWTQFISNEQSPAMKSDSLDNTHPIVVPVNNPAEIRTIFDVISYGKGASVIEMLHKYLGNEDFRNGLRLYLERHKYANTDTDDLWQALQEISDKPVKDFMHEWTNKAGFPLVVADIGNQTIELSQKRFYSDQHHSPEKTTTLWPIPLLSLNRNIPDSLTTKKLKLAISDNTNILINRGSSGFYRVQYNASHLKKLGELIARGKLAPIDRLSILGDTFEIAKAGYSQTTPALMLLQNYKNEDNSAVWDVIASCLASTRMVMDDEGVRQAMKPYTRNLVAAEVKKLGWTVKKSDTHFEKLLRPTVLGMAAFSDDTDVIDHALKLFAKLTDNKNKSTKNSIDPDIRGVVYTTVARQGSNKQFSSLLAMHNATNSSEEKQNLCAALTAFKQPKLIVRALELVKTDVVRTQDIMYWVVYSYMNRYAKKITWQWMTTNWEWLEEKLGTDMSFSRFPLYAARCFSDQAFLKQYKKFFSTRSNPALERSIKQGVETIKWQSEWKTRDLDDIKRYFKVI